MKLLDFDMNMIWNKLNFLAIIWMNFRYRPIPTHLGARKKADEAEFLSTFTKKTFERNKFSYKKIDNRSRENVFHICLSEARKLLLQQVSWGHSHARVGCLFSPIRLLILSRYKRENSSRRKSFRLRYDKFDDVTYLQHCHSSQRWSCNLLQSSITLLSRFRLASIQIHRANIAALCLFKNTNWLQLLGFRSSWYP